MYLLCTSKNEIISIGTLNSMAVLPGPLPPLRVGRGSPLFTPVRDHSLSPRGTSGERGGSSQLESKSELAPRSARLIQLRCVLACLLTALVSVSGADPSSSLKGRSGSANTNAEQRKPFPDARFILESGDVVAFVGGADVEAAQHGGHLEALLAARNRGLDVR